MDRSVIDVSKNDWNASDLSSIFSVSMMFIQLNPWLTMKSIVTRSFVLFIFITTSSFAQQKIKYGSNSGNYVSVFDTKIYYEEYGKGMPLLLLHGGLGNIRNFEKCIAGLSQHYRVIAADTPGHGRSEMPDSLTYELLADHFSKMIDLLKLDSVYVMGWSDGGVIALILAANRPDKIRRVIATGTNTRADGMEQGAIDFTNGMSIEAAEAMKTQEGFVKNWMTEYQKLSGSENSWKTYITRIKKLWLTEVYITEAKLQSIAIPVLLVYGDRDIIRLDHGIENRKMIKGSQFCILPNATHAIYDEKPALINQVAIDFFK
jgi:pimeloyl-ACP methyl ester carboxylesterase